MSLRLVFAGTMALAASACGWSPITATTIEGAIAPTFANLVHVQLSRIGLDAVSAADIKVAASCHKLVGGTGAAGSGEWVCTLIWYGPNRRTLVDTYDLSVTTDGCYTASVEGGEGQLGGPVLYSPDGSSVRNLLYAFEGCFNTT
jgi:hypothetical protein